jgi:hypothetical protein
LTELTPPRCSRSCSVVLDARSHPVAALGRRDRGRS